jgi:hypothetical protein
LFRNKLSLTLWSETWKSSEQWLQEIEANLLESRARVRRGGQYDQWDLHVTCGFFSSAKGLLTIEEHGSSKQLLRFKCKPEYSPIGIELTILLSVLSVLAILDSSYLAGSFLGSFAIILAATYFTDKARAMYDLSKAFKSLSVHESLIIPITESVSKPETEIEGADVTPTRVPNWFKETRIIRKYIRRDFREKRTLETFIEKT